MLVYCTGISQPANGTIFAPSRVCSSESGVFLCAASLTCQVKQPCDHAQKWIGFSEDDKIIAIGGNAIHLARELRDITVREQ